MEEEKSNGGRYKRAFGYSPEDEDGENEEQDAQGYLRNLKEKQGADKERSSELHRTEKKNTSIDVNSDEASGGVTGGAVGISSEDASGSNELEVAERLKEKLLRTEKKSTPFGIEEKQSSGSASIQEKDRRRHARIFGNRNLFRRGSDTDEDEDEEGINSRWLSWHFGRAFGKKRARKEKGTDEDEANREEDQGEGFPEHSGAGNFFGRKKDLSGKREDSSEAGSLESSAPGSRDQRGRSVSDKREKEGRASEGRSTGQNETQNSNSKEHSLYPPVMAGNSKSRGEGLKTGGASEPSSGSDSDGPDTIRNTFRSKKRRANKEKTDRQNDEGSASSDKGGGAYQGVFNIAGEELEAGKSFIKGKTRFARSIGEEDPDAAETGTKALTESGRTVFQIITHIITQIKNIVVLLVTMFLGPVAGAIVALIAELLLLFIIVIVIVVMVVIGIIVLVATLVTTFVSFIVGLFVDEFNNTAEMYRYAYFYAVQYEETLEQEASGYENVVIYQNDVKTTWDSFTIDYENAYLVFLGENQTAEYINAKLELAEDSVAGNLPELQADTEKNRAALEAAFAGLYYTEESEDGSTLMIHVNSPFLYSLQHPQDNQNVYYITTAVSRDESLREDLGMLEDPLEIKYPNEED